MKKYTVLFIFLIIKSILFSQEKLKHELYICADIDVGAGKWVTLNGIFRREGINKYSKFIRDTPGISDIIFDPQNHSCIYCASINGPLTSTNGGLSWRMGSDWRMTEPKSIDIDSTNFDLIYLALPDGVAVSEDKGKSWIRREFGLPARGKYTQIIKADRTQSGRLFVGTETGIYLSGDAAISWRCMFRSQATVTDIEQSPLNSKLWLATTKKDGALISKDGGISWKSLPVPSQHALYNVAFDCLNPDRYAMCGLIDGVLTTEDSGNSWNFRNIGLPDKHEIFRIAIDPDTQALYAAVNRDFIYSSNDFGKSWHSDGLNHSTVYHFVFLPLNEK